MLLLKCVVDESTVRRVNCQSYCFFFSFQTPCNRDFTGEFQLLAAICFSVPAAGRSPFRVVCLSFAREATHALSRLQMHVFRRLDSAAILAVLKSRCQEKFFVFVSRQTVVPSLERAWGGGLWFVDVSSLKHGGEGERGPILEGFRVRQFGIGGRTNGQVAVRETEGSLGRRSRCSTPTSKCACWGLAALEAHISKSRYGAPGGR